ncbi:hypothetical protein RXV86_20430 [Alisedimentitalea sp. MJ-SS2]|uniref:hypothetical protein n=1 Tax=Aliisedimentitalea sp. MJ-SS2 TaxID=3049795 RepID=UPI00290A4B23|nr:hypothetical protein [Alisedimentitalea sp. MJ-SS2]MDU8929760.1 hypothetical protein [Alisedimentitalea sp. MJ-SS2]
MHGSASWQDDLTRLAAQSDTFRHLRILHDLIQLLITAQVLPLPPETEAERQSLLSALCPTEMTSESAAHLATGPLPDMVRGYLKSLAAFAASNPASNT